MTHPGTPRDVDLDGWLDGIGFHPADTVAKQVGHAAAREFIANLGVMLHQLLPAGRDKSIVFTLLEDMLMRSNRALALGGGPAEQDDSYIEELKAQVAASPVGLPRDHRYEAEQRGEEPTEVAGVPAPTVVQIYKHADLDGSALWVHELTREDGRSLLVTINEAEGGVAEIEIDKPRVAEELSSALLSGRNRAWVPQG